MGNSPRFDYMGVSWNGGTPQIIHFNRVFHYKPSILGYHYFWKHPWLYRTAVAPEKCLEGKTFFPLFEVIHFSIGHVQNLGSVSQYCRYPPIFFGGCIKLHQRDMLCFIGDWNGFINVGSSNVAWNLGVVELLNMTCIDIFRWLEIWSLRIFGYVSCALGMQWMVTGYKSWIYVLYHHMFCYDLYYSIELLYTKTICTVKIQERAKVQ